jgi:hypothetical protein
VISARISMPLDADDHHPDEVTADGDHPGTG